MPGQSKTLEDLFLENLKDIYYAERKILVALPKMAKAANSEQLRAAFEKHVQETEGQVDRLKQVFKLLKQSPKGKTCPAILGRALSRARDATGIAQAPAFALTFHNSRFEWKSLVRARSVCRRVVPRQRQTFQHVQRLGQRVILDCKIARVGIAHGGLIAGQVIGQVALVLVVVQ